MAHSTAAPLLPAERAAFAAALSAQLAQLESRLLEELDRALGSSSAEASTLRQENVRLRKSLQHREQRLLDQLPGAPVGCPAALDLHDAPEILSDKEPPVVSERSLPEALPARSRRGSPAGLPEAPAARSRRGSPAGLPEALLARARRGSPAGLPGEPMPTLREAAASASTSPTSGAAKPRRRSLPSVLQWATGGRLSPRRALGAVSDATTAAGQEAAGKEQLEDTAAAGSGNLRPYAFRHEHAGYGAPRSSPSDQITLGLPGLGRHAGRISSFTSQ
ncbi:unnamed protein product, partial [Prorocentrum cordatum]